MEYPRSKTGHDVSSLPSSMINSDNVSHAYYFNWEEESFVTTAQPTRVILLLNRIDNRTAQSRSPCTLMKAWIKEMFENSMTQDALVKSGILPRLNPFVANQQSQAMPWYRRPPPDVVEDLTFLFRKWKCKDLSVRPRRGVLGASGKSRL